MQCSKSFLFAPIVFSFVLLGAQCDERTEEGQAPVVADQRDTAPISESETETASESTAAQRCIVTPDIVKRYCGVEGELTNLDAGGVPSCAVVYKVFKSGSKLPFLYAKIEMQDLDAHLDYLLDAGNAVNRQYGKPECEALNTRRVPDLGDQAIFVATEGCAGDATSSMERGFGFFVRKGVYVAHVVPYITDVGQDWGGQSNNGCSPEEVLSLAREVLLPELEQL